MVRFLIASLLGLLAAGAFAQTQSQMRLASDLDFPGEGYCIDIVGVGETARSDLPLVMHNCLPQRSSVDRIARFEGERIIFPAFNACVTAFGVVTPLPGSPLVLRPCGAQESFLPADRLQRFSRNAQNQLQLKDTDLCLAVGPDDAPTYSSEHRWRTLTLETCKEAALELSVWE